MTASINALRRIRQARERHQISPVALADCFLNLENSSVEEALFVIGAFMRAQGREMTAAEARELRLLLQGDEECSADH